MFIIPSNYQNSNFTKYLPHLQTQSKQRKIMVCPAWILMVDHKIRIKSPCFILSLHQTNTPTDFWGIVWKYPKSNGLSCVYHGLSLRNWPFFWGYPFSGLRPTSKACPGPPRWVLTKVQRHRPTASSSGRKSGWVLGGVGGPWGSWDFQRAPHSKTKGIWLAVDLPPLKNMTNRQLGWWHSQYMENKSHVPNHQPGIQWEYILTTRYSYPPKLGKTWKRIKTMV